MEKSPDAFRTISEVAEELDVPQHVLRFWESRFREIKPMKRGGGRRYYRPDDVDLLRGIRHLLYGEGYTIRGVQRLLREQGVRFVQSVWQPGAPQPSHQDRPNDVERRKAAEGKSVARAKDDGERADASGSTNTIPENSERAAKPPASGLTAEQLQKLTGGRARPDRVSKTTRRGHGRELCCPVAGTRDRHVPAGCSVPRAAHAADEPSNRQRNGDRGIGAVFNGVAKRLFERCGALLYSLGSILGHVARLAVEVLGRPRRLLDLAFHLALKVAGRAAKAFLELAAEILAVPAIRSWFIDFSSLRFARSLNTRKAFWFTAKRFPCRDVPPRSHIP